VKLDTDPDFTVLGVKRPAGGVRLYASRELEADFQLIDPGHGPAHWRLTTPMHGVLIIDMPDYSAAFARLFEIWANQDRDRPAIGSERKALPRGKDELPGAREPGRLRKGRAAARLALSSGKEDDHENQQ
jgi:hypothetical protein